MVLAKIFHFHCNLYTTLFHRIQMVMSLMTYCGCFSTGAAAGLWPSNALGYWRLLACWLSIRVGHVSLQWILEMWANAQRDGRPAEYRWHPLFNAAKFGWCPIVECRAVTLPRHETCWNLQGCPKLMKRSQPLVGWSSPYCGDMWRRYCCSTSFFPIVGTCLSCKDTAQQSCAIVPRWRFFCILYFQRGTCSTFQTCILNLH